MRTNPKRGVFSHSLEPSQAFFQRGVMTPTLCQLLPRNKRASAGGQWPFGDWVVVTVAGLLGRLRRSSRRAWRVDADLWRANGPRRPVTW
jgi:hypothetical protein